MTIHEQTAMDRPIERRGRLTPKRIVLGLGLLAGLLGAMMLYSSLKRWLRSEISIDFSKVRVGSTSRGDLVRAVSVQGRTVAAFHPTLFSPSPGIVHIGTRAGEVVAKGQPLGHVISPELENRLKQERSLLHSLAAELERQRIQAKQARLANQQNIGLLTMQLEAARRAKVRAEKSKTLGILTAVEYEKSQDDVKILSLRLEGACKNAGLESESLAFEVTERRSQLTRQKLVIEDLERQVEALTIRSPVAGLVSRVHIEDREAVGRNASLFTVVDLSDFEVEIAVAENYADEIAPGVEALLSFGGLEYRGKVRSISPEVEGSLVKGIVTFAEKAPAGLKQNQRISTRLILETRADVLKVPRGPFLESGGGHRVYVVENQMAVLRSIEVGAQSISEVEIVSGLDLGEQIIVSDTGRFKGAKRVFLRQ